MKNDRILREVYFSVDIEANGPCPPMNSMLSLGAVAYTLTDGFIGEFEVNLDLLPESEPNPETMLFWEKHPEAYALSRINTVPPLDAMWKFARFTELMCPKATPVFSAFPAGFDFSIVYWYFMRFLGFVPFKWQAWDAKTFATAVMKCAYRDSVKSEMPARWFPAKREMGHVALLDARSQAYMCISMMCEHYGVPNPIPAHLFAKDKA